MSTGVQHRSATRKAWIAVAFVPVAFVAAMVVGEGMVSLLGYESDEADVPIWAVASAAGPALVLFAIPCVAAWILGRRAVAAGEPQGKVPAWIGAGIGIGFVLQNLAVYVLGTLLGG